MQYFSKDLTIFIYLSLSLFRGIYKDREAAGFSYKERTSRRRKPLFLVSALSFT